MTAPISANTPGGPLAGVTVVDMSRVLSGPYCTMMLADLGARVIKIERPATGDDTRQFGPFQDGRSAYFMAFNRRKESIALDLKSPYEREILDALIQNADVLVENFRPGVMDRLGYGWEALSNRHPRLIYASISGYGGTGPLRDQPAYDMIIQAIGGAMSLTGEADGPPVRVGPSIADLGSGMFAAIGICAALADRARTGRGQRIDVAMLDSQTALLEHALARVALEDETPTRTGAHHPTLAPFGAFRARNGDMVIAAANDTLFASLADTLGRPELADQPRFVNNPRRVEHQAALKDVIDGMLQAHDVEEWIPILQEAGVPCGPINSVDKVLQNEQLRARRMIVPIVDADGYSIVTAGNPIRLSGVAQPEGPIRSPKLDENREALVREFLGKRPQPASGQIRQYNASQDYDAAYVELARQA